MAAFRTPAYYDAVSVATGWLRQGLDPAEALHYLPGFFSDLNNAQIESAVKQAANLTRHPGLRPPAPAPPRTRVTVYATQELESEYLRRGARGGETKYITISVDVDTTATKRELMEELYWKGIDVAESLGGSAKGEPVLRAPFMYHMPR